MSQHCSPSDIGPTMLACTTQPARDFVCLTPAQRNAMNHVAFNGYATSIIPSKKTLASLVDAGLVTTHKEQVAMSVFGPVVCDAYDMPLRVHITWCAHVAAEVTSDA